MDGRRRPCRASCLYPQGRSHGARLSLESRWPPRGVSARLGTRHSPPGRLISYTSRAIWLSDHRSYNDFLRGRGARKETHGNILPTHNFYRQEFVENKINLRAQCCAISLLLLLLTIVDNSTPVGLQTRFVDRCGCTLGDKSIKTSLLPVTQMVRLTFPGV